jgi:hypothetical protein
LFAYLFFSFETHRVIKDPLLLPNDMAVEMKLFVSTGFVEPVLIILGLMWPISIFLLLLALLGILHKKAS